MAVAVATVSIMTWCLALALLLFQTPTEGTLAVNAEGFENATGKAYFHLFSNGEAWPEPGKALDHQVARIRDGKAKVVFKKVKPGTYAVSVFHDHNNNGELDFSWFPLPGPAEGVGASNDAPASLGPPKWNDAKFSVGKTGKVITIRIRY